jgi:hypothetical protein
VSIIIVEVVDVDVEGRDGKLGEFEEKYSVI